MQRQRDELQERAQALLRALEDDRAFVRDRWNEVERKLRLSGGGDLESPELQEIRRSRRERARSFAVARLASDAARAREKAEVAQVELEKARSNVPPQRSGSFPVAVASAVLLDLPQAVPAWWAAHALNLATASTLLLTLVLTIGIGGVTALLSQLTYARNKTSLKVALALGVALVGLETVLVFDYFRSTSSQSASYALPEAALFGLISIGFGWMSYVRLVGAEPESIYRKRREVARLQRDAVFHERLSESAHIREELRVEADIAPFTEEYKIAEEYLKLRLKGFGEWPAIPQPDEEEEGP